MHNESLTIYLNDHSAGAQAAITLMKHLEKQYPGEIAAFVSKLRQDIEADERQLQGLIERLGHSKVNLRKTASSLAEWAAQLKLVVDDPGGGELRLLESLEILALGIAGKGALWRGLRAAAAEVPELGGMDYDALEQRALEQHDRVDQRRIAVARLAFVQTVRT